MSGPYRDQELACPTCKATLRAFQDRLCCDECSGMLIDFADLARSLGELTLSAPGISFTGDAPTKRTCPRCETAMIRCRIVVALDTQPLSPKLDLARCAEHGVWFDDLELAKLFEEVHGGVSMASYGHGKPLKIGKKKL